MESKFKFDIAISFAEEDRNIAVALACGFKLKGIKPYYYPDNTFITLGYKLTERLKKLYEDEAQYAVVVLSERYLNKPYCQLEIEAIKQRMERESKSYLVVVKTDHHYPKDLGIADDLCFMVWEHNPEEIAGCLYEMLGKQGTTLKNVVKKVETKISNKTHAERDIINQNVVNGLTGADLKDLFPNGFIIGQQNIKK